MGGKVGIGGIKVVLVGYLALRLSRIQMCIKTVNRGDESSLMTIRAWKLQCILIVSCFHKYSYSRAYICAVFYFEIYEYLAPQILQTYSQGLWPTVDKMVLIFGVLAEMHANMCIVHVIV